MCFSHSFCSLHRHLRRLGLPSVLLNLYARMATMIMLLLLALRTDTTAQSFSLADDIIHAKHGARETVEDAVVIPVIGRSRTLGTSRMVMVDLEDLAADTKAANVDHYKLGAPHCCFRLLCNRSSACPIARQSNRTWPGFLGTVPPPSGDDGPSCSGC